MIKWNELPKEKKQLAVLGVIMGAGVLYAIFQFAIMPLVESGQAAADSRVKLAKQVEEADKVIKSEARINGELEAVKDEVQKIAGEYVLPFDNPYSVVTERIYKFGKQIGQEIQSVDLVSGGNWDGGGRRVMPYAVRISFRGSFFSVSRLVSEMEKNNPYLCVRSVSMMGANDAPERSIVSVIIEWPIWMKAAGLNAPVEPDVKGGRK